MSKVFEKLIVESVEKKCSIIQLDNESEGFEIYFMSQGSGFQADLTTNEIFEINNFLRKV